MEEEGAKENTGELHSLPALSFLTDTRPSLVLQLCRNVRSVESSIHHFTREDRALTLSPGAQSWLCMGTVCVCALHKGDSARGYPGLSGELWNVV